MRQNDDRNTSLTRYAASAALLIVILLYCKAVVVEFQGLINHYGILAVTCCWRLHRIGEAEEIWLERLEPRSVWLWHRETSEKWDVLFVFILAPIASTTVRCGLCYRCVYVARPVCVCVLMTTVITAKTAEPIQMSDRLANGPRNRY